ncbi:MAG: cytochrome c maturation protein CcmE [Rhodospirillaceae bacterium]|nr:cytochrome c maturation protein CcmE [Rhodospirillaceae bacterium]
MTRKKRRLYILGICGLALGTAAALVLTAMGDTLVFFRSPTEVATGAALDLDRPFRLGGMVKTDSVERQDDGSVAFIVTDFAHEVPVVYAGILPDLFREGQGVVTEGRLGPDGVFVADEVLARHDETYMPPEVAEALDASDPGWRTRAATSMTGQ